VQTEKTTFFKIVQSIQVEKGPGLAQWLKRCATSRRVPGFFRGIRQVHVPGVDSAFRNEYQDIPGGKDGWCVGLTTLPP
jgi:hypothetical protein